MNNWFDIELMTAFHWKNEIKIQWIKSLKDSLISFKNLWIDFPHPLECIIVSTKERVYIPLSEIEFNYINPETF